MDIYEYQAKKIFKTFGLTVPDGLIAYTPNEAKSAALKISPSGPWIVKAQIQAGSRDMGRFSDKRAGKKGGIRLSKNLNTVYTNANKMLQNMLITNQTDAKGRLVSRVYIEEYIKTVKKYYFGLIVDRISASVMLLLAPMDLLSSETVLDLAIKNPEKMLKLDLGLQKEVTPEQTEIVRKFMRYKGDIKNLKSFLNNVLKIFYHYDAVMLEINPIGLDKDNVIWALDANILFDKNALYRHKDLPSFANDAETEGRETTAAKLGFHYQELLTGMGIITNGSGMAINIINEAQKHGLSTACFLDLKGGVDRDNIAASIRLIMTNPTVDGIFINIIGGFSRCNLIADGIISIANDLGLNIPLVARFEGTNKNEAIDILQSSGLPLKIANSTAEGLDMLRDAIEEDL